MVIYVIGAAESYSKMYAPRGFDPVEVNRLMEEGLTSKEIMKALKINRGAFYRGMAYHKIKCARIRKAGLGLVTHPFVHHPPHPFIQERKIRVKRFSIIILRQESMMCSM